jgi:hypothetical protein
MKEMKVSNRTCTKKKDQIKNEGMQTLVVISDNLHGVDKHKKQPKQLNDSREKKV